MRPWESQWHPTRQQGDSTVTPSRTKPMSHAPGLRLTAPRCPAAAQHGQSSRLVLPSLRRLFSGVLGTNLKGDQPVEALPQRRTQLIPFSLRVKTHVSRCNRSAGCGPRPSQPTLLGRQPRKGMCLKMGGGGGTPTWWPSEVPFNQPEQRGGLQNNIHYWTHLHGLRTTACSLSQLLPLAQAKVRQQISFSDHGMFESILGRAFGCWGCRSKPSGRI